MTGMISFEDTPPSPTKTELTRYKKSSNKLSKLANALDDLQVKDHITLEQAEAALHTANSVYEIVEDITDRFKVPAYKYYKSVLDEKNKILKEPERAIEDLRNRIKVYMVGTEDSVKSITTRSSWKARLLEDQRGSMLLLCAAVAEGKAPVELVSINQKEANKYATMLMDSMPYPGLEAYEDTTLVVRKK